MDLIFAYQSDSDDSDKEQDRSAKNEKVVKKIKLGRGEEVKLLKKEVVSDELPDLPVELFGEDSQADNVSQIDCNGKKRLFEHVDGNYPSYVYIKIPSTDDRDDIKEMIDELTNLAKENNIFEEVDDYHVSLSRVFPMREHHIDTFTSKLKSNLQDIKEFSINFETISSFVNDGQSRLFLSANVCYNVDKLNLLIRKIDQVLEQFKFPVFYDNPLPHLSVKWKLTDPTDSLVINPIKDTLLKCPTKLIKVDTIHWKIGKFEFYVNLAKQQ